MSQSSTLVTTLGGPGQILLMYNINEMWSMYLLGTIRLVIFAVNNKLNSKL